MRTEVILLALLVILGLQNAIKPIGIDAEQVLECENKKADIAFIIDSSRSIYAPDYDKGIDFLQSFVKIFKIGPDNVRIAAVSFGEKVITDLAFGFDQHNEKDAALQALKNIIFKPELGGSTNTAAAIIYARENFFNNARPNVKKLAIVLTDGKSDDLGKTKAEADLLKSQGVEMTAIGVGKAEMEELKAIASDDAHAFKVDSYGDLKNIIKTIGLVTCKACDGQAIDFNFVFDSAQMGKLGTEDTVQFIKTVVSAEDLKNGKVRVGAITAPCPDTKGFRLNSKKNIPDILTHFDTYITTEMASLITDLQTEAFDPKNGGRENARKVGVVFVSGKLSNPDKAVSEAKSAKTKGIEIFIVNMGSLNDESVLQSMASDDTSTHILQASDSGEITNVARSLVAQICKKKTESDAENYSEPNAENAESDAEYAEPDTENAESDAEMSFQRLMNYF